MVVVHESRPSRAIVADILETLPEWFGRPESTREYIEAADRMQNLVAWDGDDAVGVLPLDRHVSAEIRAAAVSAEWPVRRRAGGAHCDDMATSGG